MTLNKAIEKKSKKLKKSIDAFKQSLFYLSYQRPSCLRIKPKNKLMKTYRIETITNSKAFADFCDWYDANSAEEAIAEYKEDCHRYGVNLEKASFAIREASGEEVAIFA